MTDGKFASGHVSGTTSVPGSKSYTQRYILLSAFSGVPLRILNLSGSDDEKIAEGIAESTGAEISHIQDSIQVNPEFRCPRTIDAGESATSLRISLALLAVKRCRTEIHMESSLMRRSSDPLIEALEKCGAKVSATESGLLIDASYFRDDAMVVTGSSSSQFTSALLMLKAVSDHGERVIEVKDEPVSSGYVEITLECLRRMGVSIAADGDTRKLHGTLSAPESPLPVPTDMSSLSVLLTLGVLCSEKGITVQDIREDDLQPDRVYSEMLQGAGFDVVSDFSARTITARKSTGLHLNVDAKDTPDLCVIASVIGIFSENGVTILNSERLKGKESDRKASIIELASSFGAEVQDLGETIEIRRGQSLLKPESLHSMDHRIVMASVIASIVSGSGTLIGNLNSIHKSYPQFLDTLREIGVSIETDPQ